MKLKYYVRKNPVNLFVILITKVFQPAHILKAEHLYLNVIMAFGYQRVLPILTTLKALEDKPHKGRQLIVSGLTVKFS